MFTVTYNYIASELKRDDTIRIGQMELAFDEITHWWYTDETYNVPYIAQSVALHSDDDTFTLVLNRDGTIESLYDSSCTELFGIPSNLHIMIYDDNAYRRYCNE